MPTPTRLRSHWMTLLLALAVMLTGCAGLTLKDQITTLMTDGQQLYAEQRYPQALDKFVQVIEKDESYWRAYLWAARSLIGMGNWSGAIANGRKAFELAPKDQEVIPVFAEALFGGGTDALRNGRLADSIGYFGEFLRIDPGNARAWLNVGKAYLEQKEFRQGLGALTQGLATGSSAERSELIGELLDGGVRAFSSGQYRDSIALFREHLKYDAGSLDAYLNLAKAYWESGDYGDAVSTFRKVLSIDPQQQDALRYLLGR